MAWRSPTGKWVRREGRVLSQRLRPSCKSNPYWSVRLCRGGRKHWHAVHRLVATAFSDVCGTPVDDRVEVNHRDGDRDRNVPGNLAWATTLENRLHRNRCCYGHALPAADASEPVF